VTDSFRLTTAQRSLRRVLSMPTSLIDRLVGPAPEIEGRRVAPAVNLILGLERRGLATTGKGNDVLQRRADLRRSTGLMFPRLNAVGSADRRIPGPGGWIPLRVYRSHRTVGRAPVIVYYHGGGWAVGDLDTHDGACRMLARLAGCVVVSVDYRLAPEHPFPAPLEDAVAAFSYVFAHPDEFGGIPGAVAVMGDSAGANLAAAVCLQTREQSATPVGQSLIYPATDLRLGMPSIQTFAEGFLLEMDDLLWYRDQYLPDLSLVNDPRVSPLLAPDLAGLPPARIWTAGFDPLRDEGMAYAQHLTDAGVEVRATCFEDQVHGFFGMGLVPGGIARIADVCRTTGELVHTAVC